MQTVLFFGGLLSVLVSLFAFSVKCLHSFKVPLNSGTGILCNIPAHRRTVLYALRDKVY